MVVVAIVVVAIVVVAMVVVAMVVAATELRFARQCPKWLGVLPAWTICGWFISSEKQVVLVSGSLR